jgi:hypothetical protein
MEPGYHTSLGPTLSENLKIELSKKDPPEIADGKVTNFSIARDALLNFNKIRRYRAFNKSQEAIGQLAVVGIVNYDWAAFLGQLQPYNDSIMRLQIYRVPDKWSQFSLYDPFVTLMAVPSGGGFRVPQYVGGDFNGEMVDFDFAYVPDSDEGLVTWRGDTPKSDGEGGKGGAGDREPRSPLPTNPRLSATAERPVK